MSHTFSAWLLIALALCAANLPFANQRLLALGPRRSAGKSLWQQLLEWLLLYALVGLCARLLESQTGAVYPQGWEFYVITLALFATLAFPGFIYSHLLRRAP